MKFQTRRYFILPFIPGPKIVVEGRMLYVHKWFFGVPTEIPLDGLERDPQYGGFSIRTPINWLTGCGNLKLTGSPVGGSLVLYNVKKLKGLMFATSPIPSAGNIVSEQGPDKFKQEPKGVQYSYETSSRKIKIARKKHKADFGTYPDVSAMFEDTKLETPFGTFICNHDGTVSDMANKLMWIQAPWGMDWNGKKFKGEPINLSWNDATKLFGYGGTLPKSAALRKEDVVAYGYKKYKSGSCVVCFSGYSDWRLPTAIELLTLNFSDSKKFDWESGYEHAFSEKSKQLREQLFPKSPDLRIIWSANDNGWFAWGSDGNDSLGDFKKHQECAVLFVRNR